MCGAHSSWLCQPRWAEVWRSSCKKVLDVSLMSFWTGMRTLAFSRPESISFSSIYLPECPQMTVQRIWSFQTQSFLLCWQSEDARLCRCSWETQSCPFPHRWHILGYTKLPLSVFSRVGPWAKHWKTAVCHRLWFELCSYTWILKCARRQFRPWNTFSSCWFVDAVEFHNTSLQH